MMPQNRMTYSVVANPLPAHSAGFGGRAHSGAQTPKEDDYVLHHLIGTVTLYGHFPRQTELLETFPDIAQ